VSETAVLVIDMLNAYQHEDAELLIRPTSPTSSIRWTRVGVGCELVGSIADTSLKETYCASLEQKH
jgi:hypothetical protein